MKAAAMVTDSNLVDYLKIAEQQLKDEESRLERYLTW